VEDTSKRQTYTKKSKHGGTQTHMKSMFVIVELLHGTQEKRERKRE
jgi:hypothetical protein